MHSSYKRVDARVLQVCTYAMLFVRLVTAIEALV